MDKQGTEHKLVTYMEKEWVPKVWDFRHNEILPTTNNGCESNNKQIREDAGKVPRGAKEMVNFILQQVQFESNRGFNVKGQREISKGEWTRALLFQRLIGSDKVSKVTWNGQKYFVCHGRSAEAGEDEAAREHHPH